jgi:hypothetical protein
MVYFNERYFAHICTLKSEEDLFRLNTLFSNEKYQFRLIQWYYLYIQTVAK